MTLTLDQGKELRWLYFRNGCNDLYKTLAEMNEKMNVKAVNGNMGENNFFHQAGAILDCCVVSLT